MFIDTLCKIILSLDHFANVNVCKAVKKKVALQSIGAEQQNTTAQYIFHIYCC